MVTPASPQLVARACSASGWTAKRHQRNPPRIGTEEERLAGGAGPRADYGEIEPDGFKGVTDRAAAQDTLVNPLQRAGNLRQHVLDAGSKQEEAGVPSTLPAVTVNRRRFPGHRSHLRLDRASPSAASCRASAAAASARRCRPERPDGCVSAGSAPRGCSDRQRRPRAAKPREENSRSQARRTAADDTAIAAYASNAYNASNSRDCASVILAFHILFPHRLKEGHFAVSRSTSFRGPSPTSDRSL